MAPDLHFLTLTIVRAAPIARDIHCFELADPEGGELPSFTAGAHVRVQTPLGVVRQYSLSNHPDERHRYVIAVKREHDGRGGSMSLVDGMRAGQTVQVGLPENLFELDAKARSFVLIAGGIGITPMLAMARQLSTLGDRPFTLYYLTRDSEGTAFRQELLDSEFAARVVMHHDQGDPAKGFDLWPVLEKPGAAAGRHVYCCGPRPLMDAVRDMTGHWPSSAVHFESFGGDTKPHADDQVFSVRLKSDGRTLAVPIGRSILDTLRSEGVHVPSSCESGTCGSCKTRLIEGQADHRDLVLLEEEKADHIMVCVSRAKSPCLVLDL
ncbi:PDR/VanB family oxidoreductase [Hydrogenophaga sp. BPS33]|uniref:PDR/VanB family oxidoreductase n=1 Tax=Hydrogenophaga sp. BPS33 TaxID=2651974 RepID=UPI001320182C|nr:PDR/VanB family oxidoreductase [Hydrogenophaga sp. BPS33]QHE88374.1 oxidoreductase [Hydrogenophaga sp. BPS33]